MRYRRRYIAFEFAGGVSKADVLRTVNFLRARGPRADRAMVRLMLYDACSRRGLLRCGHRQVDELKVLMSGTRRTGTKRVSFRILGVSGTIRAAKRKFLAPRYTKG